MKNTIPKPFKRIKDFEEMELSLFVHWGLYSQLGKGEWKRNYSVS